MNEFAIEWTKDRDYAGVTAPSGTALKSRLLRYAKERPDEVTNMIINKDGSVSVTSPSAISMSALAGKHLMRSVNECLRCPEGCGLKKGG